MSIAAAMRGTRAVLGLQSAAGSGKPLGIPGPGERRMDEIRAFLSFELAFDISVADIALMFAIVLGGFVVSLVVDRALRRINSRLPEGRPAHAVFYAMEGPVRWTILVTALWIGIVLLLMPEDRWAAAARGDVPLTTGWENRLYFASVLPLVMWFSVRLTNNLTEIWASKAEQTETTFDDQLVPIVRQAANITVIIVGVLMVVQNLGAQVTSIVAGFGIGGAAIALASKDTIANLFGSIVIFVDRPFQIGDWIEIGDVEGTVETVGLRVTRIRTFANSQITVPNSQLTTTAVNNWSRMRKRRIKMTLGVTYGTPPELLEEGVKAIRELLRNDEHINQDFWLVNFTNFGASSLDIFVYCFTNTTRWAEYMQVRQDLLFKIMQEFKRIGLDFAFPTQTVHLEGLERLRDPLPNGTGPRGGGEGGGNPFLGLR